ncbi:MAG TPA: cytochrome c-type biogenesis protein CcmH [Acidimicrobiales bacterium]|nr:cytochrome c-type biogenesis protein CcmH [Acidimicrobiales bacterium]
MKTVRRWIPWAVLLIVVAVALAIGANRSGTDTSLDARTMHIASEVRCPVCEGQSAAQSPAPASVLIRKQIREDLQAGESENQILASLVNAYGVGILEKPEAKGVGVVVWVVPVIAVIAAAGGLVIAFRRWGRRLSPEAPDESDRALVEQALHG